MWEHVKSFLHTLCRYIGAVWIPSPPDRRFKIVLSRISYPLRAANRGLFREVAWRFLAVLSRLCIRHAIIYYGIDSLWKISSETYMNQRNSPHSTVPLKSNDKRAVFIKIRFCCCNARACSARLTLASDITRW